MKNFKQFPIVETPTNPARVIGYIALEEKYMDMFMKRLVDFNIGYTEEDDEYQAILLSLEPTIQNYFKQHNKRKSNIISQQEFMRIAEEVVEENYEMLKNLGDE